MLPIKQVVLYKHGVGYFERLGQVSGEAEINLHFRSTEMNDVLKSLTTLDLTSGLISSISYESTRPLERQLDDVAVRLPEVNAVTGLLEQVKGARVRVELGSQGVEGTVMGIERVTRKDNDVTLTTSHLALLVDGSGLRTFDLLEVKAVEFLDEGLRKDLQHLLDILFAAKKKDLKRLTIFAKGEGDREILVSYVVETPVWKTSYRVLLTDDKSMIQGWALVDNTQDEDWEDVKLSLVAGLPISFVHDLYSPRYKRRPIVEVREEEAYAPPELEAAEESYDMDDLLLAEAPAGMAGGPAAAAPAPARARKAVSKADLAAARERSTRVQTRTVEVGDLFHYEIENPVTVKRGQSALVPILQGNFDGKRVAVYNQDIRDKNPMSAVLFKNSTGMTLEGGPVTVLEDETYVGEAMLETMKPDEERLVPFSVELGCIISIDHKSDLEDVRMSRVVNGYLYLYRYQIQRTIYVINNKNDKELDLFLEHRFNHGWDLVETQEPVERTENFYRFRLKAPAKKTTKFIVHEKGDHSETHAIQNVDRDTLRLWLQRKYIDEKTREVLEGILSLNEQIAKLDYEVSQREQEIQEIFNNQSRLRENLQALGDTQDERGLRDRYVSELSREEDKLATLRAEIKERKSERRKHEEKLRATVGDFKFENLLA